MHEGNPPGSKPERPSNASRSKTTRRSFNASVLVAFFAKAIIVCCVLKRERESVINKSAHQRIGNLEREDENTRIKKTQKQTFFSLSGTHKTQCSVGFGAQTLWSDAVALSLLLLLLLALIFGEKK